MKKRYMIPVVGAVASAGIGYLLMKTGKSDERTTFVDTLAQAGMPDQLNADDNDQLENAKMVSEGSQFGVQYFNQSLEDEMKELDEQIER